jgi:transposase InsO family protein
MGWTETCAVDERMRFMMAVEQQEESFAAICRRFGVSRRVGYKWVDRYQEAGVEGLKDRSRAPLHHPQALTEVIAEQCLAVRHAHPSWGPVKVRKCLEGRVGETELPAVSTIGALFEREGLTVKRRLRRRSPPSSTPFAHCGAANDVWCIDFKGWFRTGDGMRCEPLTLSDAHSRYLLRCQVMARNDTEHVWPVLDAAFREFGLPHRLRSDNGPPFASCGAGGLSKLSINVIKAGVVPERIVPGKPQQNGRLERLHLTLLLDAANPPASSLREQIKRLHKFQRVYNDERPHQSLGNDTPAQHYDVSPRRFDGVLREPNYGPEYTIRRARHSGEIRWQGNLIYISEALLGEPIGLIEKQDGWAVYFGPIFLGLIAHGSDRLKKPEPKKRTRGFVENPNRFPKNPPAQPQQQQT